MMKTEFLLARLSLVCLLSHIYLCSCPLLLLAARLLASPFGPGPTLETGLFRDFISNRKR